MNAKDNPVSKIKSPNDFIVYNIGRLYILLDNYLYQAYKAFGLNPAKFNLLMVIKHVGKETGISQNELSNQLFVSAANITKLIDGLEKKEWVVRGSYDNDRRVKLIKITDKGSKLLDTVWLEHVKAINNILDNFSQADKEALNKYLEGFRKEMETRSSKLE